MESERIDEPSFASSFTSSFTIIIVEMPGSLTVEY